MARKKATKRTREVVVSKRKQNIPRAVSTAFDRAAREYIELLTNPCHGPLVHGLYPGVGSGVIFRAEYSFNVNASAGATAGFVFLTPGGNGTGSLCSYAVDAPGEVSAVTPIGTGYIPAYGFLTSNCASVRCLAACGQVMYLGAESTRSGVIGAGQMAGSAIQNGVATSVQNVLGGIASMERTPVNALEVVWRPGESDGQFADIAGPASTDGKNGICIAWSGQPVATPLRIRWVCVWEVKFKMANTGLIDGFDAVNQSKNSLSEVMQYLSNRGGLWVRAVGKEVANLAATAAGNYVRSINYGYTRQPTIMSA